MRPRNFVSLTKKQNNEKQNACAPNCSNFPLSTRSHRSPPHGLKFSTQMISVLASSFSLFKKKYNHFFPVSNISVRFQSFLSIVNIIFVLFSEEEGVYVLIGVSGRKILILLTSSEHSFYTTCCHLHRMYL